MRTLPIIVVLLVCLGIVQQAVAAPRTVTVAEGETLSLIAARHGVGVADLVRTNGLSNPDLIRAGQALALPGASAPVRAASASAGHTVVTGDTLAGIAARYGVSVAKIARANSLADPNIIQLGRTLKIPGAGVAPSRQFAVNAAPSPAARTHRVVSGETLAGIAARYGVSSRAIARASRISNPNLIVVGQRLRLPSAASALPAVSDTAQPQVDRAAPAPVPRSEVTRLIDLHSDRHGVPRGLTRAIAWQESGYQQSVISATGAIGVMQLMPETARWVGRDLLQRPFDPTNVEDNIEGGVVFLKWLRRRATDRDEAIAGYYQGLSSVQSRGLYDDTSQYVKSVSALVGQV